MNRQVHSFITTSRIPIVKYFADDKAMTKLVSCKGKNNKDVAYCLGGFFIYIYQSAAVGIFSLPQYRIRRNMTTKYQCANATKAKLAESALTLVAPQDTIPFDKWYQRRRWELLSTQGRNRAIKGEHTPIQQLLPIVCRDKKIATST